MTKESGRYVALLRGINVGGNNKVVMAELRACLEAGGYTDVSTYINSGNAFFTAARRPTAEEVEAVISEHLGMEIPVLLHSRDEIADVVDQAPAEFGRDDVRADVYFLRPPLTPEEALAGMPEPHPDVDRLWTGPGCLYTTRVTALATKSRLTKVVGTKLYREMSVRNWNTTRKLLTLLDGD